MAENIRVARRAFTKPAKLLVWLALCLPAFASLAAKSGSTGGALNGLAGASSPYLEMHSRDPIAWSRWNEAAIRRARDENKLLFVSVGYFSCHWCHVMHRESFKDSGIAALLNENFVPVKVDRELNPGLDAMLIEFVEATRGQAGWPLNVFLTPEGDPLIGGTYVPLERFSKLLTRIAARWSEDDAQLRRVAAEGRRMMASFRSSAAPGKLSVNGRREAHAALRAQLAERADQTSGGFGEGSKFPYAPQLSALLDLPPEQLTDRERSFLLRTLEKMSRGGLRDQVGGGFFRYTTDPRWRIPHFEKMLYDNAHLTELYALASDRFDKPDNTPFRAVALDTANFLVRDMRLPSGAFAASLSAVDEQGTEGGAYLVDTALLSSGLPADVVNTAVVMWGLADPSSAARPTLALQVMEVGQAAEQLGRSRERVLADLSEVRRFLLDQRAAAPVPRDNKPLAAWNGLVLSALSQVLTLDGGERFEPAARALRDFLMGRSWDGRQLYRMRPDTGQPVAGGLRDYVYVARGLFDYSHSGGPTADVATAVQLLDQAWERFRSEDGWRLNETPLIGGPTAQLVFADDALYSPSAMWAEVALALADHPAVLPVDSDRLRSRADALLGLDLPELSDLAFFHASHIRLLSSPLR